MKKSQEDLVHALVALLLAEGTSKKDWRLDFAAEQGILAEDIDDLALYVAERL